MNVTISEVKEFWNANPCGSKLSDCKDRINYFNEIEAQRYQIEWHIPLVAKFGQYRNKDVLEIGCGIGTDGLQFAKSGANYTGIDLSPQAVKTTKERFSLFGVKGKIEVANAEELPFEEESFDHVYSFGVIHHSPHTERIIEEIYRVLRPGGTICIMVYNKSSINYYIEIMFLRKIFRWLLIPKFAPGLISSLTGLDETKLSNHRKIMLGRKKMTKSEWISINTDGPDCPLAKVYGKKAVPSLFKHFENVHTEAWFFDKSHWPWFGKLIPSPLEYFLGRRWGWHRLVFGRKPNYRRSFPQPQPLNKCNIE